MEINNDCPTINNTINCSVCTCECKLREQLEIVTKEDMPDASLATIYY